MFFRYDEFRKLRIAQQYQSTEIDMEMSATEEQIWE